MGGCLQNISTKHITMKAVEIRKYLVVLENVPSTYLSLVGLNVIAILLASFFLCYNFKLVSCCFTQCNTETSRRFCSNMRLYRIKSSEGG